MAKKIETRAITEDRVFINGKDVSEQITEAAFQIYRLGFVFNKLDEEEFQELVDAIKAAALDKAKNYSQSPVWIREWDGRNLLK